MESNKEKDKLFEDILKGFASYENAIKDLEKIKKSWTSWESIKIYSELLNWSVRGKFNILSTVSALAATLLIVATFNVDLIQLNDVVRFLLSFILLLIPISLWSLIYELYEAEKGAIKGMKSSMELIGKEFKEPKKSFRGFLPWVINSFLSLAIIFIIILIWINR